MGASRGRKSPELVTVLPGLRGLTRAPLPDQYIAHQSGQGADHWLQQLSLCRVSRPGREEDPTERGQVRKVVPGKGVPSLPPKACGALFLRYPALQV